MFRGTASSLPLYPAPSSSPFPPPCPLPLLHGTPACNSEQRATMISVGAPFSAGLLLFGTNFMNFPRSQRRFPIQWVLFLSTLTGILGCNKVAFRAINITISINYDDQHSHCRHRHPHFTTIRIIAIFFRHEVDITGTIIVKHRYQTSLLLMTNSRFYLRTMGLSVKVKPKAEETTTNAATGSLEDCSLPWETKPATIVACLRGIFAENNHKFIRHNAQ